MRAACIVKKQYTWELYRIEINPVRVESGKGTLALMPTQAPLAFFMVVPFQA